MTRIVAAVRRTPGIEAASITDSLPFDSRRVWRVHAKGQPDQRRGALLKVIGPRLLQTMKTPLIAGREFTAGDDADAPRVVLVNQMLAESFWPGQDPLLGTLVMGADREMQVVGVVGDVRHLSPEEQPRPEFYLPILQRTTMSPSLVVRTARPFEDVRPALSAALAEAAPGLPVTGFRPLQQLVDRAVSPRRFFVNLLTAFAASALLLAAVGIYGVISYSVARRTPEIGIRLALGASNDRILFSVVFETLRLAAVGASLGIAGAVALSSLLSALLFGVSPGDPWTYATAAAILMSVAIAAGAVPAYRASRISPTTALRSD